MDDGQSSAGDLRGGASRLTTVPPSTAISLAGNYRQQAIQQAQLHNISLPEQLYYQGVLQMYIGNKEMQQDFDRMRHENQVKLDLGQFRIPPGAKRSSVFIQIDLKKMA